MLTHELLEWHYRKAINVVIIMLCSEKDTQPSLKESKLCIAPQLCEPLRFVHYHSSIYRCTHFSSKMYTWKAMVTYSSIQVLPILHPQYLELIDLISCCMIWYRLCYITVGGFLPDTMGLERLNVRSSFIWLQDRTDLKVSGKFKQDTPIAEINVYLGTWLQWSTVKLQSKYTHDNLSATAGKMFNSLRFLHRREIFCHFCDFQIQAWPSFELSYIFETCRRQSYTLKFPHPQKDLFLDSLQSAIQR